VGCKAKRNEEPDGNQDENGKPVESRDLRNKDVWNWQQQQHKHSELSVIQRAPPSQRNRNRIMSSKTLVMTEEPRVSPFRFPRVDIPAPLREELPDFRRQECKSQ